MIMKKISIYFIHSKDLAIRKPMCEKLIQTLQTTFDVSCTYIEEDDPEDIDMVKIKAHVNLEKPDTKDIFDSLVKNLHVRQLSNSLKHYRAYQMIHDSDDDYSIVLEDDVLFSDKVNDELLNAIKGIKKMDEKWHILFTGMPRPVNTSIDKPIINTSDIFKIFPVCDSYFVNKKTVKELLDAFAPIRYLTNIQLSYIVAHKDIKTFMYTPNIFIDGSKYGVFLSSIETNNKLFLNNEYNKLVGLVNKETYLEEDHSQIANLKATMQFATHPDIEYQFGLYEIRMHNHEAARIIFDRIYETHTKNKSLMNNDSNFLLKYCNSFAHSQ